MKIGKKIGSTANPLVKQILQLTKSKERKEAGLFVAEGLREITMALQHGYVAETLIYNEDTLSEVDILQSFESFSQQIHEIVGANTSVFAKMAYRENGAGVVAILQQRIMLLGNLKLQQLPLYLVIENIEKPGNLGAMFRTANAAGVDAILVCDPLADIYNPNCIRASLGAVFSTPAVSCSSQEAIVWLKEHKVNLFTTHLEAAIPYYSADLKSAAAIVLGSEAQGVTDVWVKAATQNIIIPMSGEVDSLNVSNAAAIVLFEALRQRG